MGLSLPASESPVHSAADALTEAGEEAPGGVQRLWALGEAAGPEAPAPNSQRVPEVRVATSCSPRLQDDPPRAVPAAGQPGTAPGAALTCGSFGDVRGGLGGRLLAGGSLVH